MKRFCLLPIAVLALVGCSAGTPVTITNQSAVPLDDVVIFGAGFNERVGHLDPAQKVSVVVEPQGETGLGISFRAGSRSVHTGEHGYFEGGGEYKVGVVVAADLSARVSVDLEHR